LLDADCVYDVGRQFVGFHGFRLLFVLPLYGG